jgi:hypothetical protein
VSFGLLSFHQRFVTFEICEALSFCEDFAFFDMVTLDFASLGVLDLVSFGLLSHGDFWTLRVLDFVSFGLGEFWTFEWTCSF